jgi:prepilin-type N-terminal cleavage/methylation domain-containing protein
VTRLKAWLRAEDGVSLIELLVAMVIMSVGVAALVAGFS